MTRPTSREHPAPGPNGPPREAPRRARGRSSFAAYVAVGIAVLASGAALVVHVVRAIPMPALLLGFWAAGLAAIVAVLVKSSPRERRAIARTFVVGIGAGLLATLAYDVSKAVLSQLDPAPWDPFEGIRVLGAAVVGLDASEATQRVAGLGFHLSNGTTFGVAFAFIFGDWASRGVGRAAVLGVLWGLFLETFQLVLYPGWMNIRFLDEFRQVSFGAHIVFGATLGLLVPVGLRRFGVEVRR